MPRRREFLVATTGTLLAVLAGCTGSGGGGGSTTTTTTTTTTTPPPEVHDSLTVRGRWFGAWMADLIYHDQDYREVKTPIQGAYGTKTSEYTIPDDLRNPGGIEGITAPITIRGPTGGKEEDVTAKNPVQLWIELDGEVVATGKFTSSETTEITYSPWEE